MKILSQDRNTAGPSVSTLVVGHYQVRGCIGQGGYGEVYEAWDSKLRRSVAIKRIKQAPGGANSHSLVREARLAASLPHAAFVSIYGIEEDMQGQCIVMELVPGRTLKALLSEAAVDVVQALAWTAQVAEAMQAAHASRLAHGDLKPSNLMVEPGGRIRILDFGMAVRDDPMETGLLNQDEPSGTIAYMAPERLHGAPPDARSDIYALGAILYEMLRGARPFASLHGLALAAAHAQSSSDVWDYPEHVPPALVKLIRAMTARQPGQRLQDMAAVGAHVAALAPVDERSPVPASRHWPRLPARLGSSAGVVLLAVALAAGLWQLAPYLGGLSASLAPYSETREMQQGLASLKLYDRPGSLEQAIGHFDTILAHDQRHSAAIAGLSLAYSLRFVSDGRDEVWLGKADAGAQQALALNAQLALAHIAHAWVLDNQGKPALALQEQEQALALDPNNYFAWHGKALALRHLRRYADAMTHAERAKQRFPGEPVFSNEQGTLHYEQGDYRAAEQAFRRSIAAQPDEVLGYANLNAALLHQDRGDEALQVLQQGLQVRPSAKLYGNLGNALFLRGDYVGAASAFEQAVSPTAGAPGEYLNWANLADTLLWIPGRREQARTAYAKAMDMLAPRLARAPNDVTLVSRMGLYAARAGARPLAEAMSRQARGLAPVNPEVLFRAGLAYELLGYRERALDAIGKARDLGYPEKFIEAEPDLVSLRRDPAYPARR